MRALILILLLSACSDPKAPSSPADYKRHVKFCLDACMGETFKKFHANGKSWGTGASSMSGMLQDQTFDRVEDYCANFYKGEECCAFNNEYGTDMSLVPIHGYKFGPCAKGKKS